MPTRKRSRRKRAVKKAAPVPVHSRVAPQVKGAEFTEIKTTIEGKNIDAALKAFGLAAKSAEQRFVYFFDTPDQKLLNGHVVVRARRVPGKQHDSTIKIRPVEPGGIAAKWKKLKGFKIEADAGSSGIVLSASLTRPVEKGLIKRTEADEANLAAIFDGQQEKFLAEMCGVRQKLASLARFGPIDVSWWKQSYAGLPVPMTAELWTRGDGATLLELSIRVASGQAAFAAGGFMAFLADLGAKPDNASQAKTKWAMDYRAAPAKTPADKPAKKKPVAGKSKAVKTSEPAKDPSVGKALPKPRKPAVRAGAKPEKAIKGSATVASAVAEKPEARITKSKARRRAAPTSDRS